MENRRRQKLQTRVLTLSLALSLPFLANFAGAVVNPGYSFIELSGIDARVKYQVLESEHFKIMFPKNSSDHFSRLALRYLEESHDILSPILKWTPREKVNVLVAENSDDANGFALAPLRVGIVLIATPPENYFSTSYTENWIRLLCYHEYVHILNIDPTVGWMEWARKIFGDAIRPNGLWPTWMLEGLAVYFETRMTDLGRGRSPYYEAILRTKFLDNLLANDRPGGITLDRVNGEIPHFPGGEVPYHFGYHLWKSFSDDPNFSKNAEEKMGELSIASAERVPYFIEGNLQNITGKAWVSYWNDFLSKTQNRYQEFEKHASLQQKYVKPLTNARYQAYSPRFSRDGRYLAHSETSLEMRSGLWLTDLSNGQKNRITDKVLGVGYDFSPDSKSLYFSSQERSQAFYSFQDLFRYDLDTHKITRLTYGARYRDPSVSHDGTQLTFLALRNSSNTVCVSDLAIQSVNCLKDLPEFSILGTPRFQMNGKILFSIQILDQVGSEIWEWDPTSKTLRKILKGSTFYRFPCPTSDGFLYTSDETGVELPYFYRFQNQKSELASIALTSVLFPTEHPLTKEIYASVMTGQGYEISNLKPLEKGEWVPRNTPDAPIAPKLAPLNSPSGIQENTVNYEAFSTLRPRSWVPLAEMTFGERAGTSVGGFLLGFDASGQHQYYASLSHHFKPGTWDTELEYQNYSSLIRWNVNFKTETLNIAADTRQQAYQKRSKLKLGLDLPYPMTWTSFFAEAYGFVAWNELKSISTHQRFATSNVEFSQTQIPGFAFEFGYSDLVRSRMGIAVEDGYSISFASEFSHLHSAGLLSKAVVSATKYQPMFNPHHVLQPRIRYLATNRTLGTLNSYAPLVGRNSEDSSSLGTETSLSGLGIRGYTDMTFLAKSAAVGSLDYVFPLWARFEGDGTLPYFVRQIHGSLFFENSWVPGTRRGTITLPSLGASVSADLLLLIRVPIRVSVQAHHGIERSLGGDSQIFLGITSPGVF